MKMRIIVAIFTLACLALIAGLILGLARQGEPLYITGINILMGVSGLVIATLVFMGIFFAGKERWTAMALAASLLLLFSALTIFSVGIFIAPVGLFLLGFSIWKLLHRPTAYRAC